MTQMSEVTVTFPSAVHPAPSAMECIISNTKYALVCLLIAQICTQHIVLVWRWHWLFLLSLTQWKQPVKSVFTIWKDKCIAWKVRYEHVQEIVVDIQHTVLHIKRLVGLISGIWQIICSQLHSSSRGEVNRVRVTRPRSSSSSQSHLAQKHNICSEII